MSEYIWLNNGDISLEHGIDHRPDRPAPGVPFLLARPVKNSLRSRPGPDRYPAPLRRPNHLIRNLLDYFFRTLLA